MTRSVALGEEWRLDAAVRAIFREIGVSHLLAISGFNLALVAWVLWRAFLALGGLVHGLPLRIDLRRAAAALVLPPIWCLAAVVGWQPSVVRAALMVTALLVARLLWRRAPALDGLAFAVLLVLVAAPDLAGTPGFQLSLAAVGGLLAAERFSVFGRVRKDHPASLPFRHRRTTRAAPSAGPGAGASVADRLAILAASAGRLVLVGFGAATFAALATAPIGAWHFGKVALAAPLAHLIAIPLFTFVVYPAAMLAMLLAAGPAPDALVGATASLAQASWELFVRICEGLARVLPGSVATGPDGTFGVAVVSLALALLLSRRRGVRRAALVALAVVAVSAADPRIRATVSFVDVETPPVSSSTTVPASYGTVKT
jgi:competence protein ComEC